MLELEIKGFWDLTWEKGSAPSDSTLSIAFSGWTDPERAFRDSDMVKNQLVGEKYISLGGGNENGRFSSISIDKIIAAINSGEFSGYQGIAFDIEEGDAGLANKFHEAFVATKNNGLKVLVTISHAAPYGITDAKNLMTAFFADENIDYLSPQLYTNGNEAQNDFAENMGVKWTDYLGAKASIIPSIVQGNMYKNAKDYFMALKIHTKGFIQWSQTNLTPTPPPPLPPTPPLPTSSWKMNQHYNAGDIVLFEGKTYRCLQAHDSISPDWTPPNTPALWKAI